MRSKLGIVGTGLAVMTAVTVLGSSAEAAIISPAIDFDVASDYDNNFFEVVNAASIGWNTSNGGIVRYNPVGANNTIKIRYDATPLNGVQNDADFLTETLSVNARPANVTTSGSLGFYTRIQSTTSGNSILALFSYSSGTSGRIRLFYGAAANSLTADGTAADIGTMFYDTGSLTLSNAINAGADLTLTLTQTNAADPVFSLSVSDAQGSVITSGPQVFTVNDTYNTAGSVGLRANLSAVGTTIDFDNFSAVVPEPTTAVVSLGALTLMTLRRRVG